MRNLLKKLKLPTLEEMLTLLGLWSLVSLVPFTASFLAEPMVQSSHPPLVAKIQAKIYSGTNNASES